RALQPLAAARLAIPSFTIHQQVAAQVNLARHPTRLPAFIQAIVRALVRGGRPHRLRRLRVPDDDVRIRANRQRALVWIKPKDFSWIGAAEFHEPVQADPSLADPVTPQDWHPVLDAGHAVGDLLEAAMPQLFARNGHRLALVL